jgi:DNA-binding HxlR family transcriptional regulator
MAKRHPSDAPPIPLPDRRSHCPLACTLDLVGDRWTLLVVRDLALGKSSFDQFLASPERIATNILAARLKWLEEQRFVRREPDPTDRRRSHYHLTPRGKRLGLLIKSIVRWGLAEIESTTTDMDNVPLSR